MQRAFREERALQCGFCTPGFVVLAAWLREREPDAGDDRVRDVLSSNLCRCTGYDRRADAGPGARPGVTRAAVGARVPGPTMPLMPGPPRTPYAPDADASLPAPVEPGDLVDAIVERADWSGARLLRAALRRVELRGCRLTGVELGEALLEDVTLDACQLGLSGMRFARLTRVVLRDCPMTECDLAGAALEDVLLERCDLRGAALHGARLTRVELRGCELDGLAGAEALRGARMPWPDIVRNAGLFAAALGVGPADG